MEKHELKNIIIESLRDLDGKISDIEDVNDEFTIFDAKVEEDQNGDLIFSFKRDMLSNNSPDKYRIKIESIEENIYLEGTMNKKRCTSCLFRHGCFHELPPENEDCKHWKLGKCYTCKYYGVDDDEWFKRGCETWCFSGCKKYKRNWKKIWELFKRRFK